MNILTFDIEEWSIEKEFGAGRQKKYYEFDSILDKILEKLYERNIKATFFCVGTMAEDFGYVIKKIAGDGHEIGCHSHSHKWANKMTREEFSADTKKAVQSLEDLVGTKVKSYRAPAFSIGPSNLWAFDVLAENGIENDSSVYPASRDFGGFPNFKSEEPCLIEHNGVKINEFPIPLLHLPVLKKKLAFSGGGYFRLLPYPLVTNTFSRRSYNMCYFHIGDLLIEKSRLMTKKDFEFYFKEEGTLTRRLARYFKSNIGRGTALKNLLKLINDKDFMAVEQFNTTGHRPRIISL